MKDHKWIGVLLILIYVVLFITSIFKSNFELFLILLVSWIIVGGLVYFSKKTRNPENSINLAMGIVGIIITIGGAMVYFLEDNLVFALSAIIPGVILSILFFKRRMLKTI